MDHVLTMAFDPAQVRTDAARTREFYRELLDRVTALPGVEQAALAQSVPFGMTAAQKQVRIDGEDGPLAAWSNAVTPEYFTVMRMPVLEGRAFTSGDRIESPRAAVINRELARRFERRERTALGQTMQMDGRRVEVVGVVQDAKYFDLSESPKPFLYLPFAQSPASRMVLHVKTKGAPEALVSATLAAARGIDAGQPVSEIRPLRESVEGGALFGIRIGVRLTMAAAACALLLALAGLYVTVAGTTLRRRREMGMRKALGAGRGAVLALTVRESAAMALAGVALGAAGAAFATRWLAAFRMGAKNPDVGVLAAAAGVVIVMSLAACTLASWKSSGMEPAVALRERV